jgi:type IV secretory pathway VirB4 component
MLSGVLSEFIESMYRTIRKTNGSVTIITRCITEITSSKIGPAIINNSATKIILRHINRIRWQRILPRPDRARDGPD